MQGRNRPWPACPPSPPNVPGAAVSSSHSHSHAHGHGQVVSVAPTQAPLHSHPHPHPHPHSHSHPLAHTRAASHAHPSPPTSSVATPSPSSSRCRTATDGDIEMDTAAMSLAALAVTPSSSSNSSGSSDPTAAAASAAHNTIASVAPVNIPTQALSPPTPAPSPTPTERWSYAPMQVDGDDDDSPEDLVSTMTQRQKQVGASDLIARFRELPKDERFAFLSNLVGELQLNEALVMSSKIAPKLKRDFLSDLPIELALHCVSFLDDARTLGRAMRVCKYWHDLLQDERLWKDMHDRQLYRPTLPLSNAPFPPPSAVAGNSGGGGSSNSSSNSPSSLSWRGLGSIRRPINTTSTYREKFRDSYLTESNWLNGGRLLTMHSSMGDSVVTSLVVNDEYIVIGMANSKIHVFDAATGHYCISLIGHDLGVWALVLVSPRKAGERSRAYDQSQTNSKRRDDAGASRRASFSASQGGNTTPTFRSNSDSGNQRTGQPRASKRMPSSDVCGSAQGWGLKRTLVVSGGCDREVRVWDIVTGDCVFSLRGHSSTIRCLKVLDGRPIAISGSRDFTLRVWDIDRGRMLRVLEGHEQSVRCIEVAGNQVVSGSYDFTCRLWDIDTGACLRVFEGHYHQIYAVAFDGERVVSGSLDSTVRVWDAASGECLALLNGHTSLVGQLQLSGDRLITGGSDGRVIVFDLNDYSCVHRLCAHDNSVTCLQFDDRFIVSGGNDGRVKLWDVQTGTIIRELTRPCDAVWRVCFRDDKCAILCQRNGKTVLEVLGFRPQDELVKPSFSRTPDW